MQDRKNAVKLFKAAERDFKALKNMTDEKIFEVEIFGFHAQQTVEKLLKAWLSKIGIKYERLHDLQVLFELLKENGQDIPSDYEELENLTDFAVTFRYEVYDILDASIDRKGIIEKVELLLKAVKNLDL